MSAAAKIHRLFGTHAQTASRSKQRQPRLGIQELEARTVPAGFSLSAFAATTTYASSTQSAFISAVSSPVASALTQPVAVVPASEYVDLNSYAFSPAMGFQLDYQVTPADTEYVSDVVSAYGQLAKNEPLPFLTYNPQEQGKVAIANKVSAMRTALGAPLPGFAESQPTPDGIGRYQVFNGVSIYWSPATAKIDLDRGLNPTTAGAHLISGAIRDRFLNMGTTNFGYPKNDTSNLKGWTGATFNDFYNADTKVTSSIVHASETGARIISGAIRAKWINLGAGEYGLPRNDQYVSHGGQSQDFVWRRPGGPISTIAWNSRTGAHDVVGLMRDKWISIGRERFGFPARDQTVFNSGSVHTIVNFVKPTRILNDDGSESWNEEWAAIVLHDSDLGVPNGQANVIYGQIYHAWNNIGREYFGVPITDEFEALLGGQTQHFRRNGTTTSISWIDGKIFLENSNGVLFHQKILVVRGPNGSSTGTTSANLTADTGSSLIDWTTVYQSAADSSASALYSNFFNTATAYQGAATTIWTDGATSYGLGSSAAVPWAGDEVYTPTDFSLFGSEGAGSNDVWLTLPELGPEEPAVMPVDDAPLPPEEIELVEEVPVEESVEAAAESSEEMPAEEEVVPVIDEIAPVEEVETVDAIDEVAASEFDVASQLVADLGLLSNGDLYENWGGLSEKWLQDATNAWYFVLPTGEVYQWDGSSTATGTLLATLDAAYFESISIL